jgi:serine/threonine-protein kinase
VPRLDLDRWRIVSPYLDQALDIGEEEGREAWLASVRADDPALAADLRMLLAEHRAAVREGYLEQASPRAHLPAVAGETIGAYTLVSPIGQGGMGIVWLAERSDGRFERRAAIKFLSLALDARREERFTREGVLLGRLSHPHIAQLLDAGVSSGGHPYLVLEYVDGDAIDHYCDTRALGEEARIRLVLDVLEGVAHAHAHLIVHRDIKPSNVLVDRQGQVKLLDFGIAKLIEDEGGAGAPSPLTQDAGVGLTPDYAAPEQVTGGAITTATDVYALGTLLYVLVTGEHPGGAGRRSAADTLKAIVDTEPRRLPHGDLGTILATALKKNPRERYESVTSLADDLRRYIRHEPISARPDTLAYRAAKFVRRNRMGVTAAVLALAALTGALYAVNRQRAIAERRFQQVRQLSARLFDVDVQVRELPGSSKTRQLIVDTSLEYLRQLSEDAGRDMDLALDIGTAHMRVARVLGVPISPNLGQTDQADQQLRTAQVYIDKVLAARPADRVAMLRSAQIAHDRMILSGMKRTGEDGLAFAALAVDRLERYLSTGPIDPKEATQVVITYMNAANRYMRSGRHEEAIRMCRRTIDLANLTNQPLQAGSALMVVAQAQQARGRLDEALDAAREAVRALEPAATADAPVTRRMVFALALMREGVILGDTTAVSLGRPADAVPLFDRAFTLADEAAEKDPADYLSRQRIAFAAEHLGRILRDSDPARALNVYDRALLRLASIKNNVIARLSEVSELAGSSYALRALQRPAEARVRLDAAFAKLAELKRYPAPRVEPGSEIGDALIALADYEASQGDLARAAAIYQQLIDGASGGDLKPETDLAAATELSAVYQSLSALERRQGRQADADALDARRSQLWETWAGALPGNPYVDRQRSQLRGRAAH